MQFDTLYMRHISLMVSWKRSLLFMAHTADNSADKLFAKGECAVLTLSLIHISSEAAHAVAWPR